MGPKFTVWVAGLILPRGSPSLLFPRNMLAPSLCCAFAQPSWGTRSCLSPSAHCVLRSLERMGTLQGEDRTLCGGHGTPICGWGRGSGQQVAGAGPLVRGQARTWEQVGNPYLKGKQAGWTGGPCPPGEQIGEAVRTGQDQWLQGQPSATASRPFPQRPRSRDE